MIPLSSVLVDIDALAGSHPALEQAVDLAARCGARVKVVDVLAWVPSNARHFVTTRVEEELAEHRRARLTGIAEAVKGVPVTVEVLRGRSAHALIQDVLRSGHDLLVRSRGRDVAESPKRFGAVDMELLRQCPCPVWLG
jgi:nucleotide-binding universal stress UspA family protein